VKTSLPDWRKGERGDVGHAGLGAVFAVEAFDFLVGGDIPDDDLGAAADDEFAAVEGEGEGVDGAVVVEFLDDLFLGPVPDFDETAAVADGEELAGRLEGDAEGEVARLHGELHFFLGHVEVPDADGVAGGGEVLLVGGEGERRLAAMVALPFAGQFTGFGVPELEHAVGGSRAEAFAVGGDGHAEQAGFGAGSGGGFLAGGEVEGADGLVVASGGELLAVGGEGEGVVVAGAALDDAGLFRGEVPDADGLVERTGDEGLGVGMPEEGDDGAGVSLEGVEEFAGGRVPDADEVVVASGVEFAVGAEDEGLRGAAGVELVDEFAGADLAELDGAVVAGGSEEIGFAGGVEGEGGDLVRVGLQFVHLVLALVAPDEEGSVHAAGGDDLEVFGDAEGFDAGLIAFELVEFLAVGDFDEADRLEHAGSRDDVPLRRERDGLDPGFLEFAVDFVAGFRIPQPQRVGPAGDEVAAIRGVGEADDAGTVAEFVGA
jgi:hypothetical protein